MLFRKVYKIRAECTNGEFYEVKWSFSCPKGVKFLYMEGYFSLHDPYFQSSMSMIELRVRRNVYILLRGY